MPLVKFSMGASLEGGALSLVCLRASWGRAEVVGALRLPLPEGQEEETSFLEETSKFILRHHVPPGSRVVLGVPREHFLLRRFETPPVKARDLAELVEFELERHLPAKREEFLYGWRSERRLKGGGHGILLGAARRAVLERAVALLRRANLAPRSVQPEPVALAAAFARAVPEAQDALLLQLGPDSCSAELVRGGRLDLTRTFPFEDAGWKETLAEVAPGRPAANEGLEARQDAALRLGAFLAERLREPLFLEALPARTLPEIRLLGFGANRSALVEKLQNELRVPVRVFSPWTLVRWAAPPAELAPLVTPLALALLGLEGARAGLEMAEERRQEMHQAPSYRATAALALLLLAVLGGHVGSCAVRDRRQVARIDAEIRALKVRRAAVEELNRRVQEKRARLDYLRAAMRDRQLQVDVLRELTALIPDDTYLSEYTYKDRALEISGLAPSASRLLPLLDASPLFKSVEFSAPIVAQGGGLERFRIKLQLEPAGG